MANKERQYSDDFEEQFRRYQPVVEILHKKYYLRDYDFDDWLQEGRIIFDKCLQSYDPDKGTTIGVLFKRSFENRICSLLRIQQAQKRKAQADACSLEEKIANEGGHFLTDNNRHKNRIEAQMIIHDALPSYAEQLSSLEGLVIMNFLKGLELEQIAAQENLSYDKIKSAFNRGRTKIITLFKEGS